MVGAADGDEVGWLVVGAADGDEVGWLVVGAATHLLRSTSYMLEKDSLAHTSRWE